ncbi:MAG: TetR/AcrR family transcriptional regulator [bacterium]
MISANNETEKPQKTRQQRRYGKTRKKLLVAAKTVMAEKGLSATTVEDITDRADVGRGSFYYHFDAKDEMIRLMMEKLLKELVAALKEDCASHTEINEVLDAMIGTHIKFFSNRWEDFVLYYQGRADIMLNESLEGIETPFLNYLSCIEELIEGALSKPISKERLRRLAYALAGFISGYYSFASVASEEDDLDGSFMALRSAFVVSLARFIKEALP